MVTLCNKFIDLACGRDKELFLIGRRNRKLASDEQSEGTKRRVEIKAYKILRRTS
jgi:hypothetical protein